MSIRVYLRAESNDNRASRAETAMANFAAEQGRSIAAVYVERDAADGLKRPELFRLLADCEPGDILLVGQIDRLTRLTAAEWDRLCLELKAREIVIVSVDLPTSWMLMSEERSEMQLRISNAINGMMLDTLTAIVRTDHEERRRRQQQGIANAKAAGGYRGRPENTKRNDAIMAMLKRGQTWESIRTATRCSNSTIARLAKRIKMSETAALPQGRSL